MCAVHKHRPRGPCHVRACGMIANVRYWPRFIVPSTGQIPDPDPHKQKNELVLFIAFALLYSRSPASDTPPRD